MNRSTVQVILVISIMLLQVKSVPVESQLSNFEIRLIFPSDDPRFEGISSALKQFWNNLFVTVVPMGMTPPIYRSNLLSDTHNWDAAIFLYENTYENSPMMDFYNPDTSYGKRLYQIDKSLLENKMENSSTNFQTLLTEYDDALYINQKKELVSNMQRIFNEELLWDIPISSNPLIVAYWKGFSGYDVNEGIIHSIFKGAHWENIPEKRLNSRSSKEVIYPLSQSYKIPNPFYIESRSDELVIQALYSSLFLIDKNMEIHPGIATQYSHSTENGSEWYIKIRDDIVWSDGKSLDTGDIKFSFDVSSFPWIHSTNENFWRYYKGTDIINKTDFKVSFTQVIPDEKYLFSSTYIVPEHIYNSSFEENGDFYLPYVGGYPQSSPEWIELTNNPITAGPYYLDEYTQGISITVKENSHYWYPNEATLPSLFDINSQIIPSSYYFQDGSLGIDSITFHFSDQSTIDQNSALLLFNTGKRDFMEFETLDSESSLINSADIKVEIRERKNTGFRIVFNSQVSQIRKFDIRKALAYAIDYSKINNFLQLGYNIQNTIVSPNFSEFYDNTYALSYNYTTARDIFRANGLMAFDSTDLISNQGISSFMFLPIISVIFTITLVFQRRKIDGW